MKIRKITQNTRDFNITDAVTDGGTDLDKETFNGLQDNIEEAINGVVLYEGNSNGEITLNDNLTNYKYSEIFFHKSNFWGSVRIVPSDGMHINTSCPNCYEEGSIQIINASWSLSKNKITKTFESMYFITANGATGSTVTNDLYIAKIVAYK